ncbi:MAG: S41 family peptidase [Chloroflexi bacterium]|nr:S41 family peptidase [Chloroflexota bacterium]MBU1749981.1 S41 family peptidase [Chloroflexota bacterium]MBU1878592.1 S41 family peptidase [Chloroflexota bacterium]
MKLMIKVLVVSVVMAGVISLSFLAGFGTGQVIDLTNWPQGFASLAPTPNPVAGLDEQFQVFWDVWRLVDGEFYGDQPTVDKKIYGAIRGMLGTLGDPNTIFSDPVHTEIEQSNMEGHFGGVGVEIRMVDGDLTVIRPMEGTPGERAGLLPGDIITHVDGTAIKGMDIIDAMVLIRGPEGSTVVLTIKREGKEPFDVSIVRERIQIRTVQYEMLDNGVAYILLRQFDGNATSEFQRAYQELEKQNPKALILDLRGNPGGLLSEAISISNQFLPKGALIATERSRTGEEKFVAPGGGVATQIPLIVLVNQGSASASEIVAGALQDHGRAKLLGETTYGKGSVQNVHDLRDGSSVRVTIAHWYTPHGRLIHEKGLDPDIVVEFTEDDMKAGKDPQLDRAIEYVTTGQ